MPTKASSARKSAPAVKKGPRGSNVLSIYEELRRQIISMELLPGTVLDEVGMTKQFKLSRSPIREAIIRLAGEGLVTVLPNRSTIVSNLDIQALPSFLDALELIQKVVTRLAAKNWSAGQLDDIKRHGQEFELAIREKDLGRTLSSNYDYHMAIAEAARNKYFKLLYGRLLDEGKRLLRMNFKLEADLTDGRGDSVLVQEHRMITAAIADRNLERAEELGLQHAVRFRERILFQFQESETAAIKVS